MEMLESEQFTRIMGEETAWFRYVDDVLIVAPKELDLQEKLSELNQVQGRSQDFAPGGSVTGFGAHQTWEGPAP